MFVLFDDDDGELWLLKQLLVWYRLTFAVPANGAEIQSTLFEMSGQRTVPNTYIKGKHLGGADDTLKAHSDGKLMQMIRDETYDYDLLVIGGGSGGLACSKVW